MPEGPSIVILKKEAAPFKGKKVLEVSGNSRLDIQRLAGKKLVDFRSWGKHFLICFPSFTLRIHFLLFGSYRINERKQTVPRLSLRFRNGELNFYTCSLKFIEEDLDDVYDWSADVMSRRWHPAKARKKLRAQKAMLACDALLQQDIFAGVGNIIKNEVLFRIRVHPASRIDALPLSKLGEMVREARNYSFDFLRWKRVYQLRKHWLVHTRKQCPRCERPLTKAYLGKTRRRTFFCETCQRLYE
ncbi:MAG TPA: DNA-formamidopyrimidine glycosylase family protein [Chitinophagaceae bacterium]|nr:DNA-formamidopyrimidine glycosylase family protein [Chitinophagaceae bacterium]